MADKRCGDSFGSHEPIGLGHRRHSVEEVGRKQVGHGSRKSKGCPGQTAQPARERSKPILAGIDGFRWPSPSHTALNIGASRMMNIEFTDCNQLAGISHPPIMRLVSLSANRFIDEPACSKPDQKQAAARKQTAITPTRFFSTAVSPPNSTTTEETAGKRHDEDTGESTKPQESVESHRLPTARSDNQPRERCCFETHARRALLRRAAGWWTGLQHSSVTRYRPPNEDE